MNKNEQKACEMRGYRVTTGEHLDRGNAGDRFFLGEVDQFRIDENVRLQSLQKTEGSKLQVGLICFERLR